MQKKNSANIAAQIFTKLHKKLHKEIYLRAVPNKN